MKKTFKLFFEKFKNLVFPEKIKCVLCDDELFVDNGHYLCDECFNELVFIEEPICLHCGTPILSGNYCLNCKGKKFNYVIARSPFVYEGNVNHAIQESKFDGKKYIFPTFAYFMKQEYDKMNICADVIVPVPVHATRIKERGYNQSEEIATELSKLINVKTCLDCLYKKITTERQTTLNYQERQENLKGSFAVKNKTKLEDKVVLLVDDIFTTGSTVNNCCEELLKCHPKAIYVLTVAHTNYFAKDKKTKE